MRGSTELLEKSLLLLLVFLLILGSFKTAAPFIGAFLWGTILAVSTYPLFQQTVRITRGKCRGLWASLYSAVFFAILMAPLLAIGTKILDQQKFLVSSLQSFLMNGLPPAPSLLTDIPVIGASLFEAWNDLAAKGSSLIVQYSETIAGFMRWIAVQGGSLGLSLLEFFLAIIIGGILLANGPAAARFARLLAHRLGGEHGVSVIALVDTTIRTVSLSVIGTALVQACLGTLGYWIAGFSNAWGLGILTFLLALIQIGAFPVWIPAALWLLSKEQLGLALFMAVWGAFIISSVDNVVRPYLISWGSRLPFTLIFIGVIGGLIAWGLIGIFLGPTLLAIVYRLILRWLEYDKETSQIQ